MRDFSQLSHQSAGQCVTCLPAVPRSKPPSLMDSAPEVVFLREQLEHLTRFLKEESQSKPLSPTDSAPEVVFLGKQLEYLTRFLKEESQLISEFPSDIKNEFEKNLGCFPHTVSTAESNQAPIEIVLQDASEDDANLSSNCFWQEEEKKLEENDHQNSFDQSVRFYVQVARDPLERQAEEKTVEDCDHDNNNGFVASDDWNKHTSQKEHILRVFKISGDQKVAGSIELDQDKEEVDPNQIVFLGEIDATPFEQDEQPFKEGAITESVLAGKQHTHEKTHETNDTTMPEIVFITEASKSMHTVLLDELEILTTFPQDMIKEFRVNLQNMEVNSEKSEKSSLTRVIPEPMVLAQQQCEVLYHASSGYEVKLEDENEEPNNCFFTNQQGVFPNPSSFFCYSDQACMCISDENFMDKSSTIRFPLHTIPEDGEEESVDDIMHF